VIEGQTELIAFGDCTSPHQDHSTAGHRSTGVQWGLESPSANFVHQTLGNQRMYFLDGACLGHMPGCVDVDPYMHAEHLEIGCSGPLVGSHGRRQ
jgi:hypothetical protein